MTHRQSLKLYQKIQKLAPASLKSTYQSSDLIHDVYLDYRKKDPGYFQPGKAIDMALLKKLVYYRKFSNDRPKYKVHRTSQYDAQDLELIARNRVVDHMQPQDSNFFYELQLLATAYLEYRGLEQTLDTIGKP